MMPESISPWSFLKHLYQIFTFVWSRHAKFVFILISLQFLQGIFPVASAWINKEIFDELAQLVNGTNALFLNIFLGLLILQVILTLSLNVTSQINQYLNNELNRRLSLQTEEEIFQQILRLKGLRYFEDPKYHELFQLASRGLQMGANQFVNTIAGLIRSVVTLLSFLGVIFFLNPILLLIILIANLPRLYQHLRFGHQRVMLGRDINPQERMSYYFSHLLSSIYYVKELRLFNLGSYFLDLTLKLKADIQDKQRQQEIREAYANLALNLLSSIVNTLTFGLVIYQAYIGQISIGDVVLYTAALASVKGAIEGIIGIIASVNEQVLFFQHFIEFQQLEADLSIADKPLSIPKLTYGIELINVSFRYQEDAPYILENINLVIKAQQSMALVGLNGSGKTTLVKLLTRLYDPTEGKILWDGIDIREFDVDEYRQQIGAIFQDFVRYDMTARENIGLGDVRDIDNLNLVQEAARKTGMHQFISDLPNQYETVLSRWLANKGQGIDLSGGQWQKIAISRMFMRDSDFLILDEPTAALDAEAEYEIFNNFASLVEDRTSLLISHRFSTVRMADYIAVLRDGQIVEYGTHDELLALDTYYGSLYSKQAMQYQ